MKYEWRKKDKNMYLPKSMEVVHIPKFNYITIEGQGTPAGDMFTECVGALYGISYALKMNLKNKEGFYDYTVFPLEGIWDLTEEGRNLYSQGASIVDIKQHMKYKLMIRQPEFVSDKIFFEHQKSAYSKKKEESINRVKLEQIEDGFVCQMLHIGSYDSEPESFKSMEEYCNEQGYQRIEKTHQH